MKKVIIMMGASGCGKSTKARNLIRLHPRVSKAIVSADNYFIGEDGVYRFDRSRLSQAHAECQHAFATALDENIGLVIVDNTNTTTKERSFYITTAKDHGYEVYIDVVEGNAEECANRNLHGVPLEAITQMLTRMDLPPGFHQI